MQIAPDNFVRVAIARQKLGDLNIKWVHASLEADQASALENARKELAFGMAYGAGADNFSELAAQSLARVGVDRQSAAGRGVGRQSRDDAVRSRREIRFCAAFAFTSRHRTNHRMLGTTARARAIESDEPR